MIIDLTYPLTKTVEYFGYLISVPVWSEYVATSSNGRVTAFQAKPEAGMSLWINSDGDAKEVLIAQATLFKASPPLPIPEPIDVQDGTVEDVDVAEMLPAPPVEVQQDEDWTKTLVKVD